MSLTKTFATFSRVLHQLLHDRRTLALIIVVPCVLLAILKYVYQGQPAIFNTIAPMILGIFPLVIMFVVTSIATLRERTMGALSRLMTTPISKLDFIAGYGLAFGFLALIQAVVASLVVLGLLGVAVQGGAWPILLTAILSALLGTALGLFTSAFASSEFQAVQFMPAFILPQLLICGLFVARDAMAWPLQWLANIMPLTYSVDATVQVTRYATWTSDLSRDIIVVVAYGILMLVLASVTIRRQSR